MDSKVIRNHIAPKIVKQLGILYKERKYLYPLIMILGELVLYKNSIINLETGLIEINIKK